MPNHRGATPVTADPVSGLGAKHHLSLIRLSIDYLVQAVASSYSDQLRWLESQDEARKRYKTPVGRTLNLIV
jgi:hypothetical protein